MRKFAIAACLACLAVVFVGGGFVYVTATSYLNVDINPSVELGVNVLDMVVDVKAYNEDGEAVIRGLDVKGMQLDEAVRCIVGAAADQGYIEEDGTSIILLTAVTDDEEQANELNENAQAGARKGLEYNGVEAQLSLASMNEARRAAALAAGIPPGKMHLIQKLWEARHPGKNADEYSFDLATGDGVANWVDTPVKDIMKAIKATRGDNDQEVTESDTTVNDHMDKSVEGKANATGKLKAGGKDAGDSDSTLGNGPAK